MKVRTAIACFVVGIVLNGPYLARVCRPLYCAHRAFKSIYLEMPLDELRDVLARDGVYCGELVGTSTQCGFSDLWRDYTITLDPRKQQVVGRMYRVRIRLHYEEPFVSPR